MEIFPEIKKLWNEWELRVTILISLSLQIILIVLGNRRKYTARYSVRIVLWLTYLSADLVATVSLGVLCNMQRDFESKDSAPHPDSVIMAFWAPFLLVHLGGPDTVTAFSLEDNELWLRHFLGLLVQVGVAFYIFLRAWMTGTYHLTFLAIPMFIAGIIKYGERTWVLWSASSEHFRDSLFLPPGHDSPSYERETPEARIHEAYFFFKIFRRLYADLIFSIDEINNSHDVFSQKSADEAFKLVELELGFLYDVLYTKASLVYSLAGSFLRSISFISTVSTFMGFLIIDKHGYSTVNVIISYVLLIGAIVLEIYAAILLLFSDWTMLWLSKHKNPLLNRIYRVISSLRRLAITENKRWSHSMAQYNLIDNCLRHEPTKCLSIYEKLENYRQIDLVDVSIDLKQYVFQHIHETSQKVVELPQKNRVDGINRVCNYRGHYVIGNFDCFEKFGWSVDVDFDASIILWHIATDLCYYSEPTISRDATTNPNISRISKLLSDYMLYLLVMRPLMLPNGIGKIRYQHTIAEAVKLFQLRGLPRSEAIKKLLQEPTSQDLETRAAGDNRTEAFMRSLPADSQDPEASSERDISKSVLSEGCRLARLLHSLETETEDKWKNMNKWDMISNVWVEMLCHAAHQCRWNQQAQQLGRGGELLTHVSLLMAHLGLTDQLKIKLGGKPFLMTLMNEY